VGPIFKLIERLYGVRATSVEQEIDACRLEDTLAARLQASAGSAALKVTRHWYDEAGKLIQCSVGLYPEGRSRYRSRLALDPAPVPSN
jgi:DNA-binding GntR family transcriptional regulator